MPKIKLTPEDKAALIEAMNNGTEPPPELLTKLFPGTAEKFDLQALDRAKIPTLEYAGKRSKAAILAEAGAGIGAAPLQIVRCFGEAGDDEWQNMIVQGDNLQFLKTCYKNVDPLIKDKVKGKVKLIYIDPPFATKSEFGGKNGERSYSDKVATAEFIESLRERLLYLKELLAADGSIFVHLDQKMSHYIKVVLDEVFEKEKFRNEVIWCYFGFKRSTAKKYPQKHDAIHSYTKSNCYIWNTQYRPHSNEYVSRFKEDENGRLYRDDVNPTGGGTRILYLDELDGDIIEDYWTDIPPVNPVAIERQNYPTQKPEALLQRIIQAASNPGDLVMDCFAGSGTTPAVAEKLGRRWIGCDFGKHSIYTMQRRMLRIAETRDLLAAKKKSKKYSTCDKCNNERVLCGVELKNSDNKYGADPTPFCVVSTGTYDFAHIMDLRKHKETYIDFVLGLFQLARDEEKTTKYKLANICAVKDNNPVEVYPVWDDRFLREVKIDEEYLRGIITQSGGKLKGKYYIITPESCTNIGDTTLKNQSNKDIHFHILTFPYKVLEEVSRKLELQEQPSSQDNVNNLITSTAFYFNEDVQLEAVRTKGGLKIIKFETKILDNQGSRFEAFSGLAMLLVDLDYEANKPFDMDSTVFAKNIAEDGTVKISGLTKSVGLIAIDKHGNESKPYNLK